MRWLIRLDRRLRRVYVAGRRVHHADFGIALVALGVLLMWDDRRDRADWLRFRST